MKKIYHLKNIFNYIKIGNISTLEIFNINVYSRVGNLICLFGIVFELKSLTGK